jgi:uncharacterized protein YdbL (DUF1318 family)
MRRMHLVLLLALTGSTILIACLQTKSEVDVKPVDINLNITGRLEVVITDARKVEEEITGSKPKRTVRPEDIGLPPASSDKSDAGGAMNADPYGDTSFPSVADAGSIVLVASDPEQQLIEQMAARHPQIQKMLDNQLVGESHTGYLVSKTTLTASQQSLMVAENSDRLQLYKLEAAKKNAPLDQVALGYYLARLGHVNRGNWVDQFNKSTGRWEWFQWNR